MNNKILKELRRQRGLNQKELGKKIGISASTVGMYEQGRREPDHTILLKLSEFFGVSTDYLLSGEKTNSFDSLKREQLANEIFNNLAGQNALMFQADNMSKKDLKQLSDAIRRAVDIAISKGEG